MQLLNILSDLAPNYYAIEMSSGSFKMQKKRFRQRGSFTVMGDWIEWLFKLTTGRFDFNARNSIRIRFEICCDSTWHCDELQIAVPAGYDWMP